MKKLILLLAIIFISPAIACPTCVARTQENSPAFFSDDFYQPSTDSMDHLYEKLVQEQAMQNSTDQSAKEEE